ncbi:hypothetical protein Javan271_0024 [Streptococcus phage Javan271]|uniref:YopX family protein n=1 Tax=Streptococcus iniae TaxID=1346 RepID=UPI00033480C7|nr:YopX family protein [Streptococcus iniae]AGM98667.1 hypothetical protein K710_0893 [Streptococcus iniae SF1]QBX16704.1 hypothetical protein Javan271_0024 [Streptococcus phage Javan271]WLR88566.1 YopX family protein [Streptococcus iniae]
MIKFRGFNKKTKKMYSVEGFKTSERKIYRCSLADDEFRSGRLETFHFVEDNLDNYILMQSTGLFDNNDVEIFEKDIVVNQYGNVGYVAYLKQEAGFVVVLKKSDYRLGHRNTGESYDVTNNHDIIGNIYENPDLLEV